MDGKAIIALLSDRPVAYHPDLARVLGGVKCAVFMCQLLYWTGKGARPDGFIWKTQAEMERETALSRYEQETARKKLTGLGVMEERLMGVPARMHYRVKADRLVELLDAHYSEQDCREPAPQFAENPQTEIAENQQTITEITFQENTQKSTAEESAADGGDTAPTSSCADKKPTQKKQPKDPPPPAVQVFRANTHRWPSKTWYADIHATVGEDEEALAFWGDVVHAWVGLGWKPTNVKGMLDHYRRREIPGKRGRAKKAPERDRREYISGEYSEFIQS